MKTKLFENRINKKLLEHKLHDPSKHDDKFNYMFLDRLKNDCKYFLGNGNRNPKSLWAHNVKDHIDIMYEIWDYLTEKPEWLSKEDIDKFAEEMGYYKSISESIDTGMEYWYFTKHGIGPGMMPKDVKILDVVEDDNWGTYIKLDKLLTTDELRYYDMKEAVPENIKTNESLSQELHSDMLFLLKNSGATEEQLTDFIDKADCTLSDILYNKEWYNAFESFLKDGNLPNIMEESNLKESIWGDSKQFDRSDGWTDEDIDLYNSIDWQERNYEEFEVPEDSFIGEVTLYASDGPVTKTVEFHKFIRPNPIYPPYYAPTEDPFDGLGVGFMYDGHRHNGYMVMDRTETQDVYDILSK